MTQNIVYSHQYHLKVHIPREVKNYFEAKGSLEILEEIV
jgi:hypothetical protein